VIHFFKSFERSLAGYYPRKTGEYSFIKYHSVQQAGVDDQVVEGILV